MLEVRHVTKIYREKGGAQTQALKDVNIKFPERGLVFLLGKSGSGKSTLLNLIGGLDAPTEGEIAIMGKSSATFSGRDFDSYRNTFIGFVFQDYDLLNEFSVEENVAIALELQHQKNARERVGQILREVDLADFAARKPNTLSGGQKQRVAIARALVKDPKIILADEPTGALDSDTGEQIFSLLKHFSEDRLVIVVSHDRESAETYGDRIIELKDGRVVSDTTNNPACGGQEPETERLSEGAPSDMPPASAVEGGGEVQLIRSHLSAARALKMGASGLRLKPFRLILTILLSVVAFAVFGLFSTLMIYDGETVLRRSISNSDAERVVVEKRYAYRDHTAGHPENGEGAARFTPEEVAAFGEEAIGAYSMIIRADGIDIEHALSNYYYPLINCVAELPAGHPLERGLLAGRLPEAADEIAVSSYFLECAKASTYTPCDGDGSPLPARTIAAAQDLFSDYLSTDMGPLKVCGVFDSGEIPPKFDGLKDLDAGRDPELLDAFSSHMAESLSYVAYVSEAFIEAHLVDGGAEGPIFQRGGYRFCFPSESGSGNIVTAVSVAVYQKKYEERLPIFYMEEGTEQLRDNQIIVKFDFLESIYMDRYDSAPDGAYEAFREAAIPFYAEMERSDAGDWRFVDPEPDGKAELYNQNLPVWLEYMRSHPLSLRVETTTSESDTQVPYGEFEIAGVYFNAVDEPNSDGFFCTQRIYQSTMSAITYDEETKYVPEENAVYDRVFFSPDDAAALRFACKMFGKTDPATDVRYVISSAVAEDVSQANSLIESTSPILLGVGLGLAAFSALLLFNFISVSIGNKKRQIGILRALGARGSDVFKIFSAEAGIIAGICTVLAVVGSAVATVALNDLLVSTTGSLASPFVFGIYSVLAMVALALVVAFLGTFIPVYLTARKKPAESIRAL